MPRPVPVVISVYSSRNVLLGTMVVGSDIRRIAFPYRARGDIGFGQIICGIDRYNRIFVSPELDDMVICREHETLRELIATTKSLL